MKSVGSRASTAPFQFPCFGQSAFLGAGAGIRSKPAALPVDAPQSLHRSRRNLRLRLATSFARPARRHRVRRRRPDRRIRSTMGGDSDRMRKVKAEVRHQAAVSPTATVAAATVPPGRTCMLFDLVDRNPAGAIAAFTRKLQDRAGLPPSTSVPATACVHHSRETLP